MELSVPLALTSLHVKGEKWYHLTVLEYCGYSVDSHWGRKKHTLRTRVIVYSVHVFRVHILKGEDKKRQILQESTGYCVNLMVSGLGGSKTLIRHMHKGRFVSTLAHL